MVTGDDVVVVMVELVSFSWDWTQIHDIIDRSERLYKSDGDM